MHKAVTVEMADVLSNYSCAVVDEIQMLGCKTRRNSFTRALLGISADELHLCGDPAIVSLIKEILKVTDDDVEEAQVYAQENNLFFMETSAKTATNVNEIFHEIAKRLPRLHPAQNPSRMALMDRPDERNASGTCCS